MKKASLQEKYPFLPEPGEENSAHQRLRAAHLKVTCPRLLVLHVLTELKGHYAADELVEILRKRLTPLPRASVYNALDVLVSHNLMMLADAGPDSALYERATTRHHHFVCTQCGTIVDVPCIKEEKPCLMPEWVPGILEEAQVIFRGRCTQCLTGPSTEGDTLPDEEKGSARGATSR
jgi:Fe2+ or Zn2+ uptake regulation protein